MILFNYVFVWLFHCYIRWKTTFLFPIESGLKLEKLFFARTRWTFWKIEESTLFSRVKSIVKDPAIDRDGAGRGSEATKGSDETDITMNFRETRKNRKIRD